MARRMSPPLCLLLALSVLPRLLLAVSLANDMAPGWMLPSLEKVMSDIDAGKPYQHREVVRVALKDRDVGFLKDVLRLLFETKQADIRNLFDYDDSNRFTVPGYTLMHYAAWNVEDPAKLKVLADAGADFNKATDTGVLPIHNAGQYGNAGSMRFLLQNGADAMALSSSMMNAATMAARAGHVDVLRAMKEHGGEALLSLTKRDNPQNKMGFTPLMQAVTHEKIEVIRFLIFEVGWGDASVDQVALIADKKAKEQGETGKMELDNLRQLGCQHSLFFKQQRETYFMSMGEKSYASKAELTFAADALAHPDPMSAATMAARSGRVDVLRAMNERGGEALLALTKRPENGVGYTPLVHAVMNGHTECMRFLIFEVSWGDASVDEVVRIAEERAKLDKSELDNLGLLGDQHSSFFKRQRAMHFMSMVQKPGISMVQKPVASKDEVHDEL